MMYVCLYMLINAHYDSKKDARARARARATFLICSSIPRGGVVVVTPRGGGRFHENFMKTPISWNFEVQKCAWNKIILHMVHALLRDPLRGGRDHFTARKFDQIRSRFDQFCDFLAKIVRFEGFSTFVFHLTFKICWTLQYL